VEDELAAGGGGVDCLLQAAEPDPAVGQAGDGVDQVPQRPSEPVQFPDDQGVAGPQLVQDLLEDRAVATGAAGGLGEHLVAAAGGHATADFLAFSHAETPHVAMRWLPSHPAGREHEGLHRRSPFAQPSGDQPQRLTLPPRAQTSSCSAADSPQVRTYHLHGRPIGQCGGDATIP
jgi:hypothetical protein